MGNMLRMAIRAALLRRDVYRQAASDPEIILKSLGVVILSAIALSLGLLNVVGEEGVMQPDLSWSMLGDRLISVWLVLITMLLGWVLWTLIVYLLGSRFLGGKAVYHQLLRVIGLCHGPGALFLLRNPSRSNGRTGPSPVTSATLPRNWRRFRSGTYRRSRRPRPGTCCDSSETRAR